MTAIRSNDDPIIRHTVILDEISSNNWDTKCKIVPQIEIYSD